MLHTQYMFYYDKKLKDIDISNWDLSSLKYAYMMFYECESITSVDMSKSDMSNLENATCIFSYCTNLKNAKFGNATTSKLKYASGLFSGCQALESVDVSTLNTSSVTDISSMFFNCRMLQNIDVSSFDTSKVTDMSSMFSSCESLESIDVSGFDTSKVTKMSYMFYSCSGLSSLDISGFDTSNATNMNNMFRNCSSLTSLDVSGFDTSKVTNISRMFSGCTVLPYVDLSGFSTSKVTKADYYADVFTDSPLLLANCNSYYTQYLTKGYQTTIETVFTPSENAKTVIVSVGDRSEEFNIEDIPDYYYSAAEEDGVYLFTGENLEGGICAGLYNDAEQNDNISSTSEYSGPFTIRAKLNASQTVYLRPTGYNSYDSCDYTVSVTKKEVVVREPIALTLDTETEGNFEDIDDYDRFSFTADEDGTYIIKGKTHEMRDIYG